MADGTLGDMQLFRGRGEGGVPCRNLEGAQCRGGWQVSHGSASRGQSPALYEWKLMIRHSGRASKAARLFTRHAHLLKPRRKVRPALIRRAIVRPVPNLPQV